MGEYIKKIRKEIIDNLLTLTIDIVGENAVKVILTGLACEEKDYEKNIVFAVADRIQELYGLNGGHAIFREIGREVAKNIISKYPEEKWEFLMKVSLKIMGFANGIQKTECGACVCNCTFYTDFLKPKDINPLHHTICWAGLGFIEGFARKLEPGVVSVKWKERDYENNRCIFEYIRGENGEG